MPDRSKTLLHLMYSVAHEAVQRHFTVEDDDDVHREVTVDERFLSFCFYFFDPEPVFSRDLKKLNRQYINPREYGSCAPFAHRMAVVLCTGPVLTRGTNADKNAFFHSLATDICSYATRGEFVFTVTYGIHGFSFVTRRGFVELIQVFAGPSGFSIATSIKQNKVYSLQHITLLLHNFDKNTQGELFGGTIDEEQTYATEYIVRQLAPNAEDIIKQQFHSRRELFKKLELMAFPTCLWS